MRKQTTVIRAALGLLLALGGCSGGTVSRALTDGTGGGENMSLPDGSRPDQAPDTLHSDACVPSCGSKQCGPDGCGSSCGTCPTGATCSASGTCVLPECPCWAGACSSCYCGSAIQTYESAHGCTVSTLTSSNSGDLFTCSGSTTAPATWSVGTTCSAGCQVNSSGPDTCKAPACPCYYGACNSCYCGTGALAWASSHGCTIPIGSTNSGDLLSCSGSTTAPATWSVGTACTYGCTVAPPMVPDYCNGAPGSGYKLWVAYDGGTGGTRGTTDSYWNCVLNHTNMGTLATTYSTGRALAWGGSAVLGSACSVVHSTGATVSQDSGTLQCIENQTGWSLGSNDVLLYYPNWSGCQDGRNHWHIPVVSHGTTVYLEAAFAFTGSGATCQQALGFHEAYEASSDASAADCCNGQSWTGCSAVPPPYGWYSFSACGATWEAQEVTPGGHEFSQAYCSKLTVH